MEDSISMKKTKDWFEMLSELAKIEFLEYCHTKYPHKYAFATMSEPERRFHNPSAKRPTHQEEA